MNGHAWPHDMYEEDEEADTVDKILVLYASETGNAQDVAERTGRDIRRRGGRCTIMSMEDFDISELPHTPLLILITSTHGRGQPPPAMLPLWTALLRSGLPSDILDDVHFALFGLGDSGYEKFCYAGKILARRMLSLGAHLIRKDQLGLDSVKDLENGIGRLAVSGTEEAEAEEVANKTGNGVAENGHESTSECLGWGDERAPDGIEETFIPWLKNTVDAMLPFLPPPLAVSGKPFQPLPSTSLPPPLYAFDPVTFKKSSAPSRTDSQVSATTTTAAEEELNPGWSWASLQRNERVTDPDWWQDVREVELDLEDPIQWNYAPGSICSLKPETSDEEIETFLKYTDLKDQADKLVVIRPLNADQPIPRHLPQDTPTTLRQLLKKNLDLRGSPRKSFFEWLRRIATEEREVERLDDFITDPDEIYTYAIRPSRTILETISDFRALKIPISHLLEILPPLRRRQFSIASSSASHPRKVQLLIALVDYKTNLAVRRRGLLSSWLRDLENGARIPIHIDEPTLFLPDDYETPVVLVGPGTGVAPMRAFVEERIRSGSGPLTALYFGCRSHDKDLYYFKEMEDWKKAGVKVRIACSRDQEDKVYVQDLIKEDAELINDWLYKKNGNIYISGSSNAMPKSVRQALAHCISDQSAGHLSEDDAQDYVEQMFESGNRGGEESW